MTKAKAVEVEVPSAESTALEPKPTNQALSPAFLANDLTQFQDHFEKTALQVPFLRPIQANSPELIPGDPKYIESAKQGQIVNTVSGETFKEIEVIPCFHYSTFMEWVPRNNGGGFVKDHGYDAGERLLATCVKPEGSNRDTLPNGNELVATETYFVLHVREGGEAQQAIMSFTSTQLKKARNWNSKIRMKKTTIPGVQGGPITGAPMFLNTWKITTTSEKNDKGSWHGIVIQDGRSVFSADESGQLYLQAKAAREWAEKGTKAGAINVVDVTDKPVRDEEIPF